MVGELLVGELVCLLGQKRGNCTDLALTRKRHRLALVRHGTPSNSVGGHRKRKASLLRCVAVLQLITNDSWGSVPAAQLFHVASILNQGYPYVTARVLARWRAQVGQLHSTSLTRQHS